MNDRVKTVIGLTGPTGSGKSTASKVAVDLGFKVIDCDKLAREAVEKGEEGLKELCLVFGKDILDEQGNLNRKVLAKKAFSTKENTELLNKTLLPHIVKLVKEQMNAPLILLDAPTLFESGINSLCNSTVAVLADEKVRLARITERDGISTESAILRINAGKTDDFYKQNADFILYNDDNLEEFINNFEEIINNLK